MRKLLSILLLVIFYFFKSQLVNVTDAIQSNTHLAGLDYNILFNATTRYQVTCNNPSYPVDKLFDGSFEVFYANPVPTPSTPFEVTIENLPNVHTQAGAWIGWSTRYGRPKRFKIEGYNVHPSNNYGVVNGWATIVDYSSVDYPSNSDFVFRISGLGGSFTKLRYTIYSTDAPSYMGLSELFFIHPEATTPYNGLFMDQNSPQINLWRTSGNNIFNNTGNVGIGVENPTARLEVSGSETLSLEAAGFYNTTSYGNANDKAETIIHLGKIENGIKQPMGGIGAFPANNTDSSNGILSFYSREAQTLKERVRINSNGNVGIGTADPQAKLDVVGKSSFSDNMKVNAKIEAKEVKVTTTPTADFVFAEGYQLPKLEAVEKHIKEKKHLPEIASAKEMEKEGVNVGEFQIKLLQKIEELTLYTIEQNKQIEELKKEINQLKTKK